MKPILILFAHPALQKSRVNRQLLAALDGVEGILVHDLYEAYPDLHIDVSYEQQLVEQNHTIVFQHPFYWYSTPAMLKEWQDLVLEHGWAYGRQGIALEGKQLLNAVTTGGREETYQRGGYNRFTVRDLLSPIEQTAHLCKMKYLPPFVVHGTHLLDESEIGRHAADYRRLLIALRDGTIDIEAAMRFVRINSQLSALIPI